MKYLPTDINQAIITLSFIVTGVIIHLWGQAIGRTATCEDYKVADTESEVMKLRRLAASQEAKIKSLTKTLNHYQKKYHIIKSITLEEQE